MLSDAAVKSELKLIAKSFMVNSGNLKRRMVWLTHVCQVSGMAFWKGAED